MSVTGLYRKQKDVYTVRALTKQYMSKPQPRPGANTSSEGGDQQELGRCIDTLLSVLPQKVREQHKAAMAGILLQLSTEEKSKLLSLFVALFNAGNERIKEYSEQREGGVSGKVLGFVHAFRGELGGIAIQLGTRATLEQPAAPPPENGSPAPKKEGSPGKRRGGR